MLNLFCTAGVFETRDSAKEDIGIEFVPKRVLETRTKGGEAERGVARSSESWTKTLRAASTIRAPRTPSRAMMEGPEGVREGLLGSAGSGSWTFRTFVVENPARTSNQVQGFCSSS